MLALIRKTSFLTPSMVYISVINTHITFSLKRTKKDVNDPKNYSEQLSGVRAAPKSWSKYTTKRFPLFRCVCY